MYVGIAGRYILNVQTLIVGPANLDLGGFPRDVRSVCLLFLHLSEMRVCLVVVLGLPTIITPLLGDAIHHSPF